LADDGWLLLDNAAVARRIQRFGTILESGWDLRCDGGLSLQWLAGWGVKNQYSAVKEIVHHQSGEARAENAYRIGQRGLFFSPFCR
jgi:hypothetical protein